MAEPAHSNEVLTPSDEFHFRFRQKVTDLQERIAQLKNISPTGGEQADAISQCRSAIARLSGEVNSASSYLPNRSREEYGKAIAGLNEKLDETCATLAPRSKFSFRSGNLFSVKKNESAISLGDAAELADQRRRQGSTLPDDPTLSSFAGTPVDSPPNEPAAATAPVPTKPDAAAVNTATTTPHPTQTQPLIIRDLTHSHIRPTPTTPPTGSATLSNLTHCIVDLRGLPSLSSLTIRGVRDSLIVTGRVAGAAHVTGARDSALRVTARQVRVHESARCGLALRVAGRPIIEACEGMVFGPRVSGEEEEEEKEGGDGRGNGQEKNGEVESGRVGDTEHNYWADVDDFRWLRAEPSPNWRVMDERERKEGEQAWRRAVVGVEESMRDALGVLKNTAR